MTVRVRDLLFRQLGDLRYEPIDKRIRAVLGEHTVVDTVRALLVWEPKRVVPSYAVPVADVDGELAPAPSAPDAAAPADAPRLAGRPVYDPSVPFAVHTAAGQPMTVGVPGAARRAAAFRPVAPELEGYVILDFAGFDAFFEEDERNLGHPRDPFHRIDIVHSSRHVRVERAGELLAESTAPRLLFEPPLPVRFYLPAADVRADLLPSTTVSVCAYKGEAAYRSLADEEDIAWSYATPLREAAEVTGYVAFFNERLDLVVDGTRLERPVTPWSPRAAG